MGTSDESPWRDAETLRRMYHDEYMSTRDIGGELGCSYKTVLDWMDRHGIERRDHTEKTRHPELKDGDLLREWYVNEGLSGHHIADRVGCALKAAYDALHRHGVGLRTESEWSDYPELYDEEWLREQYEEKTSSEVAELVGCSQSHVTRAMRKFGVEVSFPSGEEHWNWKPSIEAECEWCGAALERQEWESDEGQKYFCDRRCHAEWQRDGNLAGENNPQWSGGKVSYYGENWYSQRRSCMERDGFQCRVCGTTRDEHRAEFGEDLHVHHIRRLGWFTENFDAPEWWELGNALENLVTLCEPHHDEWEGIPLAPEPTPTD